MIAVILVTITHLIWVFGWWCLGHTIYLLARGCKSDIYLTCSFTNFASEDFIGGIFLIGASYLYVYIGHKVINALYKGELPDGSPLASMDKLIQKLGVQMNGGNRKTRRSNKP